METLTYLQSFQTLRREVDRLFDNFLPPIPSMAMLPARPELQVVEHDDAYVAKVNLPGLDLQEIKVEVLDDTLTVQATKKQPSKEAADGDSLSEEQFTFCSFTLPRDVRRDDIKAAFDAGVLSVTFPKAEVHKPRLIEIENLEPVA